MQVFKNFFRLLKSYKGVIILYLSIFMGVAVILSDLQGSEEGTGTFEANRLDIGIIDRDRGTFAKGFTEYFGKEHTITSLKDDEEVVINELYWRAQDYVLVIPEGFEESLKGNGKEMELNCMKVPGSFESGFFEAELSMYLSKLMGLMKNGETLSEAFHTMQEIQDAKAEVTMAGFVNENQGDRMTRFFLYVPYLFITLCITGVGMVLLAFNQKEIKDRIECSSTTLAERIAGLTGGILVFGGLLYILTMLTAVILTKGDMLHDSRTPYFMLNIFAMLLFCLSLGFFTGMVAKNSHAISGINNVISLGLCFIGGIFVPQELFGEGILKVAKFFPTYWYAKSNSLISGMSSMTDAMRKNLTQQIAVVFVYAVAIFAITTVVISCKRKRAA